MFSQKHADDTQLYVTISKDNQAVPVAQRKLCLTALHIWLCYNGLDRFYYLPLSGVIAKILLCDPDLLFDDKNF